VLLVMVVQAVAVTVVNTKGVALQQVLQTLAVAVAVAQQLATVSVVTVVLQEALA
jgi:hypothetical protein